MTEDDLNEYDEYDSGPFCQHWGDPSDCDEVCARPGCSHICGRHLVECHDCSCEKFVNAT